MKEKIHPNYGKCIVRCVCGETFETGSTKKELRVDICSKCHPFYTGKQKLVDTGGRVERFNKQCPVFVCTFLRYQAGFCPLRVELAKGKALWQSAFS